MKKDFLTAMCCAVLLTMMQSGCTLLFPRQTELIYQGDEFILQSQIRLYPSLNNVPPEFTEIGRATLTEINQKAISKNDKDIRNQLIEQGKKVGAEAVVIQDGGTHDTVEGIYLVRKKVLEKMKPLLKKEVEDESGKDIQSGDTASQE